jgi:uncharacterized protein (DUF1810 family)
MKATDDPSGPPLGLERFVEAQASVWADALAEVRAGRKRTHWMWFVFPQLAGLGQSSMARHYAVRDLAEAREYLAHPVLGPRLHEITDAAISAPGASALAVFGAPDDLKLHSSATLFSLVSPPGSVFHRLLARWFDGEPDAATLRLLGFGAVEP